MCKTEPCTLELHGKFKIILFATLPSLIGEDGSDVRVWRGDVRVWRSDVRFLEDLASKVVRLPILSFLFG